MQDPKTPEGPLYSQAQEVLVGELISGRNQASDVELEERASSTIPQEKDQHLYKSLHFKDFDGKGLGFSGTVAQGARGFFDMGSRGKISEGTFSTVRKSATKEAVDTQAMEGTQRP